MSLKSLSKLLKRHQLQTLDDEIISGHDQEFPIELKPNKGCSMNSYSNKNTYNSSKILNYVKFLLPLIFIYIFISYSPSLIFAQSFIKYRLPFGISLDIPKGWEVINENTRVQLNNAIEARSGKSRTETEILFAAKCFTESEDYPSATLTINYTNMSFGINQISIKKLNKKSLLDLRKVWVDNVINSNKSQNISKVDISTINLKISRIASKYAIEIQNDYIFANNRVVKVIHYIIPFESDYIQIDTSYQENQGLVLQSIIDRIISSLEIVHE